MDSYTTSTQLRSRNTAKALLRLLIFLMICLALLVIFTVIEMVDPVIYLKIEGLDALIFIGIVVAFIVEIILFCVWVHRLHADLQILFNNYPLTAGDALKRTMIPIYNLWGLWNIFDTLSQRLKLEPAPIGETGTTIKNWLTGAYVVGVISRFIDRVERHISETNDLYSIVSVLSWIFGLLLAFVWYILVMTCDQAVGLLYVQKMRTGG